MLLIINAPFLKQTHVSWYTKDGSGGNSIQLFEVVESHYKHPEAPEDATIPVIEIKFVKEVKRTSLEAGALVLLEANQNAVEVQFRVS